MTRHQFVFVVLFFYFFLSSLMSIFQRYCHPHLQQSTLSTTMPSMTKSDVGFCGFVFSVMYAPLITVGTLDVYYGIANQDDRCQQGVRVMTLSNFILTEGIFFLLHSLTTAVAIFTAATPKKTYITPICMTIATLVQFVMVIFILVGIVILATSESSKCLSRGSPLASIGIVSFIFTFWALWPTFAMFAVDKEAKTNGINEKKKKIIIV